MQSFTEEPLTSIAQQFVIEANDNYDVSYRQNDVYPLPNLASQIVYHSTAQNGNNMNTLNFVINTSAPFTDRDMIITLEPLVFDITRHTAATTTGAINSSNFIKEFFNNYSHLAYKQFGILNAVNDFSITIDNATFSIRNPAEALRLTAPYSDKSIIFEKVDASIPDLMNYEDYMSTAQFNTIGLSGEEISLNKSVINNANPFSSLGDMNYNSRMPIFSFDKIDTTKKICTVKTDKLTLLLPFSQFTIPGEDAKPIVGAKKIILNISFKSEWWKYIFCSPKGTDPASIISVDINRTLWSGLKGKISTKFFTPPSYITNAYFNNNLIPDYNSGYQTIQYEAHSSTPVITKSGGLSSMVFNMATIPKNIYIAAKKRIANSADAINIADVYARIKSLEIEMDGKITILGNDANDFYWLGKKNGLSYARESCYLSGFPIKLNVSDDLAGQDNSLVGQLTRASNSFIIRNMTIENVDKTGTAQEYEIQVVFVYDSLLAYNSGRFNVYESLLTYANGLSISLHAGYLYNNTVGKQNVLGGNFMGFLAKNAGLFKKIGRGVWSLAKNKEFRDTIANAFTNKGSSPKKTEEANWNKPEPAAVETSATVGGAFSRKTPTFGGFYPASNVTGGADLGRFSY